MKQARIAELKDNHTVVFDDGTVAQHDLIILCTGYHMSYPFLKNEGLVKLSHKDKYWPLHKRVFCVDDPRLMFIGQHDTGFLKHFVTER
jgi:Flavin-binding monooxygenase-like